MPQELDSLPVPIYHSANGPFDAAYAGGGAEAVIRLPPPQGGIAPFAVRKLLRIPRDATSILVLQRCTGVALAMVAWIVLLAGMAHFVVAALHNREGELGLGLDATMVGGQVCLLSFALAAAGVPLWVRAERRLRKQPRVVK